MPIYEYRCEDCQARFERLVKLNAPIPPCPTCEGTEVTRLVSAAGFILKGSGWYKDHYGLKKSSGGDGSQGASGGSSGDEGSSSSSDAPAGKSDAPSASKKKAEKKGSASKKGSDS
jgi:putative FmdB family regulatory protein